MEEEMHGLSEGLLELGCLPEVLAQIAPRYQQATGRENALTRSGGETEGPCTEE